MRGVSIIIVTVLLVIIIVSIVGLSYTFFTSILSTTTQAAQTTTSEKVKGLMKHVRILSMSLNDVYIRNMGIEEISEVDVLVDEKPTDYVLEPPVIESERIGTVKIIDFIKEGDEVKIGSGGSMVSIEAPDPCKEAVLCLDFDEGFGNKTYDKSGNGNNGILKPYLSQFNNADSLTGWRVSYSAHSDITLDLDRTEGTSSVRIFDNASLTNRWMHLNYDFISQDWSSFDKLSFYIKVKDKSSFSQFTVNVQSFDWNNKWGWYIFDDIVDNEWTRINIDLNNPDFIHGTPDSSDIRALDFIGTCIWNGTHCDPFNDGDFLIDDIWVGNSSVWTTGKYDSALNFDGIDDYVNASNGISLRIIGDLTIDLWVKPEEFSAFQFFVSKEYRGEYEVGVNNDDLVWRAGNGTHYRALQWDDFFSEGTDVWYHVAIVRNATGKTVTAYKNGVQFGSSQSYNLDPSTSSNNVNIGRRSGNSYYFNGTIDEARIYNKAIY